MIQWFPDLDQAVESACVAHDGPSQNETVEAVWRPDADAFEKIQWHLSRMNWSSKFTGDVDADTLLLNYIILTLLAKYARISIVKDAVPNSHVACDASIRVARDREAGHITVMEANQSLYQIALASDRTFRDKKNACKTPKKWWAIARTAIQHKTLSHGIPTLITTDGFARSSQQKTDTLLEVITNKTVVQHTSFPSVFFLHISYYNRYAHEERSVQ